MPHEPLLELRCCYEKDRNLVMRRSIHKAMGETMKTQLTFFTKLTIAGLVAVAIALWTQWLSGDPAYPSFPPGPVLFIAVAGIIFVGRRWWWTPLMGALISLLTTSGWFVRLPAEVLRLTHPGLVGKFAAGIFVGTLLQIVALVATDIAGLVATVQNYRHRGTTGDSAKMACRFFGGIFVLMGNWLSSAECMGISITT
jgi:hypothetical protein